MIGRTLHRYRIVEQVGQGGMAVVYRGVDESLERDVAVKVLHPHLAQRIEHRRRLLREARAVARLHHPNILKIYDFSGEESPDAYIVTELIRGRTLRAFATEHPFDPPELAAACVHVLAGALAHAHANGIVHRDLKPDNVMIHEEVPVPIVKLMDFGIAQILDRDERMTVTGSLIGSPAHMAPEIIDGEEADARSDLFSLGTILYWLATGALPFEGPSPGALLKRILACEYTDPRELRPAVSDSLARVIADLLARDRAVRLQSAEQLREALARSLAESGVGQPEELLARFLRAPAETARDTRATVVLHLMHSGDAATAERRHARALACYSRIIAIVPGTPEAGAAREAIDRLKAHVRRRRQLGWLAGLGAGAGLVALAPALGLHPLALLAALRSAPPAPAAAPVPAAPAAVETPPAPGPAGPPPDVAPPPKNGPRRVIVQRHRPSPLVVTATAPAEPGRAFITVKPYAHVAIDGRELGETPWKGDLPAGLHKVRLTHECCEPMEVDAAIVAGKPFELRKSLVPKPARLFVHVDGPPDTQIMVDGQYFGLASEFLAAPLRVPLGTDAVGEPRYDRDVKLSLFRTGYRDQVKETHVRAGQETTVQLRMEPDG